MDQERFLRDMEATLFTVLRAVPVEKAELANEFINELVLRYPEVQFGEINYNYVEGLVAGIDVTIGAAKRRFLTQNPKKRSNSNKRYLSEYAKKVKAGHKITWIIDTDAGEFTGRIEDGDFIASKPKETEEPTTMAKYIQQLIEALPNIDRNAVVNTVEKANELGMLK
jgi:hypothetical protein